MRVFLLHISFASFFILFACQENTHKQHRGIVTRSTDNEEMVTSTEDTETEGEMSESDRKADTTTSIEFEDIAVRISRFITDSPNPNLSKTAGDTIVVTAAMGETIEGQLLLLDNTLFREIHVEQRFETSLTVMKEGPHCDLTDWLHYTSPWKTLKTNGSGQFFCSKYSEKETRRFKNVGMNILREEVKKQCGEDWSELLNETTSPMEYPCGVGISRYFIRISGILNKTNLSFSKLIIIEMPMGC